MMGDLSNQFSKLRLVIARAMGAALCLSVIAAAGGCGTGKVRVGTQTGSQTPSNDAKLSALSVSADTLSPVFSSTVTVYTMSVATAVGSITVTPVADDAAATVVVDGAEVVSGAASGSIALAFGDNTITVVVTAADGTTHNTYTVTVTRQQGICAAPIGLQAAPGDMIVALAWTASANATGYYVQRAAVSGGPYTKLFTTAIAATAYTDTGLTDGMSYYYVVTASNPAGESPNSSEVSATPTASHVLHDSNGWTVVTPSSDSQTIYVSSSGSNAYDGLSPAFTTGVHGPKQTIAAGVALLRNNMPDELLIEGGDSFNEGLNLGALSGRSASEPILVSTYGGSTDRPILGGEISIGGGSHVVVLNLNVVQGRAAGVSGASVSGSDILLEDCRFDGGQWQGIGIGGTPQSINIRARRNVIYQVTGHGFFIGLVDTLLIEENVIYDIFSAACCDAHGMYGARGDDTTGAGSSNVTTNGNLVFIDQADATMGNGIMLRTGGIARGNVIVGPKWTGITMGECNDSGGYSSSHPCFGTNGPAVIDNNLLLDAPGGMALAYKAAYIQTPTQVTNNIVLRGGGIQVGSDQAVIANNIVVGDEASFSLMPGDGMSWNSNSFLYTGSISHLAWLQCTPSQDSGGTCANFSASGNRYYPWSEGNTNMSFNTWAADTRETGTSTSFSFVDPIRSLGTYNGTLGGAATTRAFFETAAAQSKYNYDPRYTASAAIAYIRAGLVIASP